MADSNLADLAKKVRANLLEVGLDDALNLLQESTDQLNAENQVELDSYFLRLRDLKTNSRKGFLPAEQYAAQRSKLEADFLAFLRIIPNQVSQPKQEEPAVQEIATNSSGHFSDSFRKSIQGLVSQGRLDAAFNALNEEKEKLPTDLKIQATTMIASWKDLRRSKNMGLIDFSTQNMRTSQITLSLLELVS